MKQNYALQDNDLLLDVTQKGYVLRLRDLPLEEKPREKLIQYGSNALSVAELLAVVLNVGTKKEEVLSMTSRVLKEYGEKAIINPINPKKLTDDLAIPLGKACQIVACFELGRRFFNHNRHSSAVIRNAEQVYDYVKDMRHLPKEQLRGLYLNSHYQVIHDEVISIGSMTANIVHPREVFKPALEYSAIAVVIVHNHPSGIGDPSKEDIEITDQLSKAGKILGVDLLDHIIVTERAFKSIFSHL